MRMDEDKRTLRARMRRARAALPQDARATASRRICEHITTSTTFQRAERVALYLAHGSEVDLMPLAKQARRLGKALALPRLVAPGRMQFRLWRDDDPLAENRYGIGEPAPDSPMLPLAQLDVVLVPGVAFDRSGGRLGMGQGYYDRALAPHAEATPLAAIDAHAVRGPLRIGVAFDLQLVPAVPVEAHDLPMDALATETGLHRVTG